MKAKAWAALAAVGAIVSFLAVEIAQHYGFLLGERISQGWRDARTEAQYRAIAEDMNRQVPMQADAITRLDRVDAENMTVTYNYTLLEIPAGNDIETLGAGIKQNAKTNYCGPSTTFRNDGVAVEMKYSDTSGRSLYTLRVAPEDC